MLRLVRLPQPVALSHARAAEKHLEVEIQWKISMIHRQANETIRIERSCIRRMCIYA